MLRTVSRAVQCLFAITEQPDGLTLSELARTVRASKATVHRIVATLKEFDLITTSALTGRLCTGPRCIDLGRRLPEETRIRELARPYLVRLRDMTGETACLHLRFGYERACVDQVESNTELKWVAQIGKRFPLTAGAPGKAMVAFLPEAEQRDVLAVVPLKRFTQDSITDSAVYKRELREVRRRGWARAINENVPGSAACAAPVLERGGVVVGAVTVAGAAHRLTPRRLREVGPLVCAAAAELSAELQGVARERAPLDGGRVRTQRPSAGGRAPGPRT